MALPIIISTGDPGHLVHHDTIHAILDDVDAPSVFDMARDYQDVFANRPAAGRAGSFFIATDTDIIQRDNGSAWQSLSSLLSDLDFNLKTGSENVTNFRVPVCRVGKSVDQSIPNNVSTAVTWDVESGADFEDASGLHSLASNTSRFTATIAGWYHLHAWITWDAGPAGQRFLRIVKNAGTYMSQVDRSATGGGDYMEISGYARLAATDYIEFIVVQQTGGSLDVNTNSAGTMRFVSGL